MSDKSSSAGSKGAFPERKAVYLGTFNTLILVGLLATRAVPWGAVVFVVFASVYAYLMHKMAFPPAPETKPATGLWRFPLWRYFDEYIMLAAVLGLLLPLMQIVISFLRDDEVTVRESAPHLFLLAAQVVSENLSSGKDSIALPVKALIPVMYNSRRLLDLSRWATTVFSRDLRSLTLASTAWDIFGMSLAVGNLIFWNYNLWGFLLPIYVPWCMRVHYGARPREE